ncbi:helix-hairpin-helix domain-containing protein [Microbispora sp. CA-102843]|uniref:helix-hairpin-helix domain-containing protein n=1 Tax=Microbispora sp. CA-102843 TaxID=3239952 RepID=UPI003D8CD247
MRSKESRGAARGVVGESRLRGLLRPLDPFPPSARLRSTPSPPGPPPSFGAPHVVRTETYVPDHPMEAEGDHYREGTSGLPEEVADRWEGRADGPGTSARNLRTLGRAALGRALPRLDPGMPGLRVLVAAGLLAALVTGILAWRSRPVAEPIAPPLPAAAVRDLRPIADHAGDHVADRTADSAAGPDAAPGSAPHATSGPGVDAGPGATAYVAGTGGTMAATPGSSARVVVYVTGKVRNPGVFVLASGSRVADAIEAAGGLRKGANPGGINLARRVVDGEQIVAGGPATAGAGPAPDPASGMTPGAGVVNLNTATAEQLDALPGIGGVIAQRIVDYRDAHGGFQSVDQLKDVPGIGDRKFAEMRDKVSV